MCPLDPPQWDRICWWVFRPHITVRVHFLSLCLPPPPPRAAWVSPVHLSLGHAALSRRLKASPRGVCSIITWDVCLGIKSQFNGFLLIQSYGLASLMKHPRNPIPGVLFRLLPISAGQVMQLCRKVTSPPPSRPGMSPAGLYWGGVNIFTQK